MDQTLNKTLEVVDILGGIDNVIDILKYNNLLNDEQTQKIDALFETNQLPATIEPKPTDTTALAPKQTPIPFPVASDDNISSEIGYNDMIIYYDENDTLFHRYFSLEKANKIIHFVAMKQIFLSAFVIYFGSGIYMGIAKYMQQFGVITSTPAYKAFYWIFWAIVHGPMLIYVIALLFCSNVNLAVQTIKSFTTLFKLYSALSISFFYVVIYYDHPQRVMKGFLYGFKLFLFVLLICTMDSLPLSIPKKWKTILVFSFIMKFCTSYVGNFFRPDDREFGFIGHTFSAKEGILSAFLTLITFLIQQLYTMIKHRNTNKTISSVKHKQIVYIKAPQVLQEIEMVTHSKTDSEAQYMQT